jgi:2-C-methyl-D-erythritol 4-phosphate cytidylyltransferase
VVAAGTGTRFGGSKQFAVLHGRSVLEWSIDAAWSTCDHVIAVVPPGDETCVEAANADVVVAGGDTRSASVRQGLSMVPVDADIVVVHDAARPLAGPRLFGDVVAAVRNGADAAICAVPVVDTIKAVDGEHVTATLDRGRLVAVQTPQAFRADRLRASHAGVKDATDDAALVEAAGGKVVIVSGDPRNIKLTAPVDLVIAEALFARPDPHAEQAP